MLLWVLDYPSASKKYFIWSSPMVIGQAIIICYDQSLYPSPSFHTARLLLVTLLYARRINSFWSEGSINWHRRSVHFYCTLFMVQPHSLKMSSWTAESAASLLSYIFYVHRAATERKVGVVALNMPWDSCGLPLLVWEAGKSDLKQLQGHH